MDVVFLVLGTAIALVGLAALLESITGSRTLLHPISRRLVAYRGREQGRTYKLLASLAHVAFGVFIAMPGRATGFPLWPAAVALGLYALLGIAAHLQVDEA